MPPPESEPLDSSLIQVESHGPVAIARLNRPEVLNALSPEMLRMLSELLGKLDADNATRVMIITGSGSAFSAGADIRVMASATPMDIQRLKTLESWKRIWSITKPLIAAVNGIAYGGGCELALSCDLIVAAENARFAQPEIKLGIMPGAGGTQRLAKTLGPYRAMEMILTGEPLGAQDAFQFGLVNRLVPRERCLIEALELAQTIAARPPVAVRLAREALRYGFETTLRDGLEVERRNYTLLFDTEDQKEGMAAFLGKRSPQYKGH